jgi:hypothetical protein
VLCAATCSRRRPPRPFWPRSGWWARATPPASSSSSRTTRATASTSAWRPRGPSSRASRSSGCWSTTTWRCRTRTRFFLIVYRMQLSNFRGIIELSLFLVKSSLNEITTICNSLNKNIYFKIVKIYYFGITKLINY